MNAGDRGRRALVDVRRPDVERRRGGLEQQADGEQRHAGEEQHLAGRRSRSTAACTVAKSTPADRPGMPAVKP